jgi:hypothetical protein
MSEVEECLGGEVVALRGAILREALVGVVEFVWGAFGGETAEVFGDDLGGEDRETEDECGEEDHAT